MQFKTINQMSIIKFCCSQVVTAFIILCMLGSIQQTLKAQNHSVAIGTLTPDHSAVLDLESTNQGFLMPRMDSLAIMGIAQPAVGLIVYNTQDKCYWFKTAQTWKRICSTDSLALSSMVAHSVVTDSLVAHYLQADSLFAKYLRTDTLYANYAKLDTMVSKFIDVDTLLSKYIYTNKIAGDSIVFNSAKIDSLVSNYLNIQKINADTILLNYLNAHTILGHIINGHIIKADSVYSFYASIDSLFAKYIYTDKIRGDSLIFHRGVIDTIISSEVTTTNLHTDSIYLNGIPLQKIIQDSIANESWTLNGNTLPIRIYKRLGKSDTLNTFYIGTNNNMDLQFRVNALTKMILKKNGYLGIGTTNPITDVDVQGRMRMRYGSGKSPFNLLTGDRLGNFSWTNSDTLNSFAWLTSGNKLLTQNNFLGTIDSVPVIFKSKAQEVMRITPNGFLGINKATPSCLFDLYNGSVLFEGVKGRVPISGAGTRFMYVPALAALRVGSVSGMQFDSTFVGAYSVAFGSNNEATSPYSFIQGQNNTIYQGGYNPAFIIGNANTFQPLNDSFRPWYFIQGDSNAIRAEGFYAASFLMGNSNKISGAGGENYLLGDHNSLTGTLYTNRCNYFLGRYNNVTSDDGYNQSILNIITGNYNSINSCQNSFTGGKNNIQYHCNNSFLYGNGNNLQSVNNSFIFGQNNLVNKNPTTVVSAIFIMGNNDTIAAETGFFAGINIVDAHYNNVVFNYGGTKTLETATSNAFYANAIGGVYFYSYDGSPVNGVQLAPGAGSWASVSDRTVKENIKPIDVREILDKFCAIPIAEWNYIAQRPDPRYNHYVTAPNHIGIMAQDFNAAFGYGEDAKKITDTDLMGVLSASVMALNQKIARIEELEKQLDELRRQVELIVKTHNESER